MGKYKLKSESLERTVAAAMKLPPYEQTSCLTEVALMREVLNHFVEEYIKLRDKAEQTDNIEIKAKHEQNVLHYAPIFFDMTDKFVRLSKVVADIDNSNREHISPLTLRWFIDAVQAEAREQVIALYGDTKANEFSANLDGAIKTKIQLPTASEISGSKDLQPTEKTPADDVDAMDATIPRAPDPQDAQTEIKHEF